MNEAPTRWKRKIKNGYRSAPTTITPARDVLTLATDASYKGTLAGWGYAASDGRWGLRIRIAPPKDKDPTGPHAVLINELRAAYFALTTVPTDQHVTLLVDSMNAVRFLQKWQDGSLDMPDGYRVQRRRNTPTLRLLADKAAGMRHLTIDHVRAHRNHPLNEAAHALSVIARKAVCEDGRGWDTPDDQLAGMVAGYVGRWQQQPDCAAA